MHRITFGVCVNISLWIVFVFTNAGIGIAQDDDITMNHSDLGTHTRPIVTFPHKQHEDIIECRRCHHDYDEFMTNIGEEEQSCTECHFAENGSKPVPLMKALHMQCKGCHKQIAAKRNKKPPLMCGQCHKR